MAGKPLNKRTEIKEEPINSKKTKNLSVTEGNLL